MKNDFFATDDVGNENNTPNANNAENGGVIINLGSTTNAVDSSTSNVDTQNTYYGTSINTTPVQNENVSNVDSSNTVNNFSVGNNPSNDTSVANSINMGTPTNTEDNFNAGSVLNNADINQGASSTLNNNEKPKRNKKIFIIIGIIVGVIILAIIGVFVYVKFKFTAPNYIDEKVEEFSTFIDEMFANNNLASSGDNVSSGSLKISSNMDELSMLNDLTLDFDFGYSSVREVMDLNINLLKSDNSILDAQMYVDSANMYLNSEDLYDSILYMPLDENPFVNINAEDTIDINALQNTLKNFVSYLGIALEEAEVTSEIKGLTAIYTYQINDSNKEAFANRLEELIENDTDMVDTLNMLGISDTTIDALAIDDIFLEIIVKIPSGDIERFTFVTTDLEIVLDSVEKDVYELKVNDEVIDVNVNGDDVTLNYENDNGILNVTYNLVDYTLSGNLSTNGYEYKFDITNTDDNGKNIVFDFKSESDGISLVLDLTTTKISDTESNLVGSVEINSNDINLALDIEMNNKTGSDLVEEQTFNNAVNVDTLTTADQNEIENNLMIVLDEIVPGVMDNARMQQFLLTAQINASTASVATYPGSCITLEQLGSDGSVWGKVEVDSTGGYRISITDGTYMILNKYVSYGSELAESDVELYDQSRFTEQYYTCLVL